MSGSVLCYVDNKEMSLTPPDFDAGEPCWTLQSGKERVRIVWRELFEFAASLSLCMEEMRYVGKTLLFQTDQTGWFGLADKSKKFAFAIPFKAANHNMMAYGYDESLAKMLQLIVPKLHEWERKEFASKK